MDKKMQVKPFHLFEQKGCRCLINIEDMSTQSVDEKTFVLLEKLNAESGTALQSGTAEHLGRLGLIAEVGDQARKEVKKETIPLTSIPLFLTQSCNLNCTYCYGAGGKYGSGGNLDEKTAYQAVDWFIEQSGKQKKIHLGFFGGEPFLNFPMMQVVAEYASKRVREVNKEVDFYTTTNATLLNDEKIAFIKKYDISVLVSFDGPREIQDAQRPFADGNGSYDVAVPKIKKLLEICPKTPAHAVITGNTDPKLVKRALQEIGFTEMSIKPASTSLFDEKSEETRPERDLESVLKLLEQESEKWIEHTKNRDSQLLKKLKSTSQLSQGLLSLLHNTKKHFPCGAGLGMAAVSCSGDIYLCHRFVGIDNYKLGNVFNNDLDREKYQKSPVTFVDKCSKCFAKYHCAGGCKHDNVGSCDSIFEPPEDMCRLTCRETELAAYIACQLTDEDRTFLAEHKIIPDKPCPLDFG
ncbi:MAG: nif11-like peptide radical SAM maturase [Gammaproteobacteria bacterium]|nr:nif11-like peptide radical SAM maturase [Gammaproteobacteria bacterium]